MGIIQSIFCSITFCLERVLTWACCAFLLILLMATIIVLMVYGISVGYHYAQKELANYAMRSKKIRSPGPDLLRSGDNAESDSVHQQSHPVVRLVAVNKTQVAQAPAPMLEIYQTRKPGEFVHLGTTETAIVILETERVPKEPALSPQEREMARKLIGRFRRSRPNMTTERTPFFRPLRNTSVLLSI